MITGFRGTFVICSTQTEVDGVKAASLQSLTVGAQWSWHGRAVRVDGPQDILRLAGADGSQTMRRRAARIAHRLTRKSIDLKPPSIAAPDQDDNLTTRNIFVVSDGIKSYRATAIEISRRSQPLLMFEDDIPPSGMQMWVTDHSMSNDRGQAKRQESGGVICFTPGTAIETPMGPQLIENLREGDQVQTKDNGAQDILWIGKRRMTGARLVTMPRLRPVRITAGALGIERPDNALLVSPDHRVLVKGALAHSLFNTDEVLVAARDLVNDSTVKVDASVREVTYIHLLLPNHEILSANGVETESFHPANAALSALDDSDRERLLQGLPELDHDPHIYGAYARRNLNSGEAAILQHIRESKTQ